MTTTAEAAYIEQHTRAAALLQELQDALFDLPAPDAEIPINWGHVGTMTELNRQLAESLAFIRG